MTVKEFRAYLAQFPDDMEILETRCSDLGPMELDSWYTVQGIQRVSGKYGWVQRAHQMTDENRSQVREYLHYGGN